MIITPADAYLRGLWADPEREGRRIRLAMDVLDRPRSWVVDRVARLGLRRPRANPVPRDRWALQVHLGTPVAEIARACGVCPRTVTRHIRRVQAEFMSQSRDSDGAHDSGVGRRRNPFEVK